MEFVEGSTVGVRHDVTTHSLSWFFNGRSIGTSALKEEMHEKMRELFPVFALYVPDQVMHVEFRCSHAPSAIKDSQE